MKKTKSKKAPAGTTDNFAYAVAELLSGSPEQQKRQITALLSIEESANAMEGVLDYNIASHKKLALIRLHVEHIQRCIMDATSLSVASKGSKPYDIRRYASR